MLGGCQIKARSILLEGIFLGCLEEIVTPIEIKDLMRLQLLGTLIVIVMIINYK